MTTGKHPPPGDGRGRTATTLCGLGWLVFIIAWNWLATDPVTLPRAVAVLSAIVFACVTTVQIRLRKLAFTAWVITCVLTAFCFPTVFLRWGDFELKTLIVPLMTPLLMYTLAGTLVGLEGH